MRTDTKTFAKRVFRDLRTQGISSVKAKIARDAIVRAADRFGFPELSDAARVRISIDSIESQSVYIEDEGMARFVCHLDDRHQPLISTEPTEEQLALSSELVDMLWDLYAAADEKSPAYEHMKAEYNAKRDAILAINPHVHANVADPDSFDFYHNIHKSEYGFRPRGFVTEAMMRKEVESILRNAKNVRVDKAA